MRTRRSLVVGALLFLSGYPLFPATTASHAASPEDHPAVPAILARAESLFRSMKSRDYPAIFAALSAKSRQTIVEETSSALAAAAKETPSRERVAADAPHATPKETSPGKPSGADVPRTAPKETPSGMAGTGTPSHAPATAPPPGPEAVRADFVAGGPIARDYWDAFLLRFDPDVALEHSRWEIGSVGDDRAEILLTRHGADRPATLKMYREDGGWKVGLVETFWSR